MKRRKLLKSLGLGLSAGLIMPQMLISCKKDSPGPEVQFNGKVAIIGAGPAGLYAADILHSKGVAVTVFEAGAKIGGRVRSYHTQQDTDEPTDSFLFVKSTETILNPDGSVKSTQQVAEPSIADFPIELGPETIIGSDSIWGRVMSDLNISTYDMTDAEDIYVLANVPKTASGWAADGDFLAVQTFLANLPNLTTNGVSVEAAASVSARASALLNSVAGNPYGGSSNAIDAGLLGTDLKAAAATHDAHELNLKATTMEAILFARFANIVKSINLNTQIKSVSYGSDKVTLTDAGGGTYDFDKVIVTVPLSVMKSGVISFTPSLPSAMTNAFSKFAMTSSIRVILDFKANFWGNANTGYIWGGTDGPQYFNAGVGRTNGFRTLTVTINGAKAVEMSALGAGMIPLIIAELDAIYDGAATKNIRHSLNDDDLIIYQIQDWTKEPFINGGASYPVVGATADDRLALSTPIDGKIFFAGEVTDVSGNAGTVNGAFKSAERVANEVVESILLPA